MKFAKPFSGAPDGVVYPIAYATGDDCPKELEHAAREAGALEVKAMKKAPETK